MHATPAKRLTTQTMFPVFIVVEGPMEGSVGSMARRSKNLCFSMSNRGVEVDLTWKTNVFRIGSCSHRRVEGFKKGNGFKSIGGVQILIFHVFLNVFEGRVTKPGQRF